MENRKKILMKLFVSTLYLSAFTFGGGYVIVTLMKKKFVDEYHWTLLRSRSQLRGQSPSMGRSWSVINWPG